MDNNLFHKNFAHGLLITYKTEFKIAQKKKEEEKEKKKISHQFVGALSKLQKKEEREAKRNLRQFLGGF